MRATLIVCSLLLAGCAAPKAKPTTTSPSAVAPSPDARPVDVVAPPQDAEHVTKKVFQIVLYQLAVPQGSISANATFWKPFDETFLGVWQHDVLGKNGLRVGKAAFAEVGYLSDQLADAEQIAPQSIVGQESKTTEISVRKDVAEQVLFCFNKNGESEGRNFLRVEDLFAIGFRQTPRHQDQLRFTLAPMIRGMQSHIEVTNTLPLKLQRVTPQTLYDLGITFDLRVGECVVIAPNESAATNKMLVGRVFMMEERPTQLVEKVIVIRPMIAGTLTEVPPTADAGR